MTKKATIIKRAIELLSENPKGLRYSELSRKIEETNPEITSNTIKRTIVSDLSVYEGINKPVPGFFILSQNKELTPTTLEAAKSKD